MGEMRIIVEDTDTTDPNFTVFATEKQPVPGDILRGHAAATGTLITVPAGRAWKGSLSLTANVTLAGNATCFITVGGVNVLGCACQGLALSTICNSASISGLYLPAGSVVGFVAGGAGISYGSAVGVLL